MRPDAEKVLRESTYQLFERYEAILSQIDDDPLREDPRLCVDNLIWMCCEGRTAGPDLPLDKISRWLGFIQGCLAMRGCCDVDEERDITRPMFRKGYELLEVEPGVRERPGS
jgi:hypothetical protein